MSLAVQSSADGTYGNILVNGNPAARFNSGGTATPTSGSSSVSTTSTFTYNPSTHGQVCEVTLTNAITVTLAISAGTIVPGTHYTLILKAGDTSIRSFAKDATLLAPSAILPITSGSTTSSGRDILHLYGISTNSVAVVGSAADVR